MIAPGYVKLISAASTEALEAAPVPSRGEGGKKVNDLFVALYQHLAHGGNVRERTVYLEYLTEKGGELDYVAEAVIDTLRNKGVQHGICPVTSAQPCEHRALPVQRPTNVAEGTVGGRYSAVDGSLNSAAKLGCLASDE